MHQAVDECDSTERQSMSFNANIYKWPNTSVEACFSILTAHEAYSANAYHSSSCDGRCPEAATLLSLDGDVEL
jgi:hypothetical protein